MHKTKKSGSPKKANATGSGADRYSAWQWAITETFNIICGPTSGHFELCLFYMLGVKRGQPPLLRNVLARKKNEIHTEARACPADMFLIGNQTFQLTTKYVNISPRTLHTKFTQQLNQGFRFASQVTGS